MLYRQCGPEADTLRIVVVVMVVVCDGGEEERGVGVEIEGKKGGPGMRWWWRHSW